MSLSYSNGIHSNAPAHMLESNDIYFAYKLGYLSGANIRKEARKPEPRLFKLIGHASLFDCTRKYITEHTILESDDESEVETTEIEELVCDETFIEGKAEVVYIEDIDREATLIDLVTPSKLLPQDSWSYSQPEGCPNSMVSQTLAHPQNPAILTWEDESDSSTEPGDDAADDEYWSDSTCEEEDVLSHLSTKDYDRYAYSTKLATFPNQPISKANDDQVIWSEQPRIMSIRQVEDLFAETFG